MSKADVRSVITPEMQALVGKELSYSVSHPIGAQDIRRWALAVYFPETPPARFLSSDGPLVAPEEFNPFAWAVAETSRTEGLRDVSAGFIERQAGVEPPPLESIVNGGVQCTYGEPMREGDVIRGASLISGYSEKIGKRGLLLFTQMTDRWTNQRGELVKATTITLVRY